MSTYADFLASKAVHSPATGFEPGEISAHLFPFQAAIVRWALRRGKAAIWADAGFGKTLMQLEWARAVCEHSGGDVLILAPLAVSEQTVQREAPKFGEHATLCRSQADVRPGINVTNYEMLEHFDATKFAGVVLDESGILKSYSGSTRLALTEAFSRTPYRLACTATPAPNDFMEIGTHAEFLGAMKRSEMLSMFFMHDGGSTQDWRLKGHAERDFWRWVCSWAVMIKKPSDIGFSDDGYNLPPLDIEEHLIESDALAAGVLFDFEPTSLDDRRRARRNSIEGRIRKCVELAYEKAGGTFPVADLVLHEPAQAGPDRSRRIHAPVLPGTPGEVGADGREEGAQESPAQGDVRDGSGRARRGKAKRRGVAAEEPQEAQATAPSQVCDDGGRARGDACGAERGLRDLRALGHVEAERLSAGGPLPCDGDGARAPLHVLQSGAREVQGQSATAGDGGGISARERPRENWLIWCDLNAEQDALEAEFGDHAFSVRGSMPIAEKVDAIMRWVAGERPVMISKPSVMGFGLNLQHCARMAFVGLSDSYEAMYQAIRRCWRFGQVHAVDVHVITSTAEGAVLSNVKRKEQDAETLAQRMVEHMSELQSVNVNGTSAAKTAYAEDVARGVGDCVEALATVAADSIGYSVFSPPFASLYTYSNSDRDMGNCTDHATFFAQFKFLVSELLRVTKPGRLLSFHCMNLPTSKVRDGVIGITDFRGELIRTFSEAGWIYHSEVVIWKDPVTAMQRTKALGLLHKQLKKDSCMSRQGIPDYLVTMRKPGENPDPVQHSNETFPVQEWQEYASPV